MRLDPKLDPGRLATPFARSGRLHLPGLLADADARALAGGLAQTPWSRTFTVGGKSYDVARGDWAATAADVRQQVEAAIAEGGRTGFQYDFDAWRLSDHMERGEARGGALAPLEAAYDFLNGEAFLGFVRRLTAEERAVYCDAQATRYGAGQFLTAHDDDIDGKNRLYAYVLNLTPAWRTEWGGLLLFHDADGHVIEGYAPRFNSLNIFRVPQLHSVSQVASYVEAERLAITGWIRSAGP